METAAHYARREIGDALYVAAMRQPEPARAAVILRDLPHDMPFGPTAARETLASDPRFTEVDGRYDVALRASIRSFNFNPAMERLIGEVGRPVDRSAAAAFFASSSDQSAAYYEQLIANLAAREELIIEVDGKLALRSWFLFPEGDSEDDVLFYCDLDVDKELALLKPFLSDDGLAGATPLDTAANIVAAAGEPLRNKLLGFFVWRLHPDEFDPRKLLLEMLEDDRVYSAPGLLWLPGGVGQDVRDELGQMSAMDEGGSIVFEVDLEKVLSEPLPPDAPGYFIKDRDLVRIYDRVNKSPEPVGVGELLIDILDLYPEDEPYIPAAHSIYGLLHNDPSIVDVDLTTFMGPAALPAWVKQVPEPLVPFISGAAEDAVLAPEGLDNGLADKLADPYLEDYRDDDVTVDDDDMTEDETFYPLTYPHLLAGTMKLRKMDQRFFGVPRNAVPIDVFDRDGNRYEAWANADLGIILGIKKLYEKLDLKPGALLGISRGNSSTEFVFDSAGDDDTCAIPAERFKELLQLRAQADREDWTLFNAVCGVMAEYPEGVQFETVYAQVNVIRRATRQQVASILTCHLCFRPTDAGGEQWIFSYRAVNAGTLHSKKDFIIPDWGVAG